MKFKKLVSTIICLAFVIPSLAKTVSAEGIANVCAASGMAGYYASVSKAAFDMVNVIFEEFFTDISKNSSKKQQPAKAEEESSKDNKAVFSASGIQKTFKTNSVAVPYGFHESDKDIYLSKIMPDKNIVICFWMILLLTRLILSIRKQDDYAVSSNICVNKHPVCI